jgi:hypothetical protein
MRNQIRILQKIISTLVFSNMALPGNERKRDCFFILRKG